MEEKIDNLRDELKEMYDKFISRHKDAATAIDQNTRQIGENKENIIKLKKDVDSIKGKRRPMLGYYQLFRNKRLKDKS